MRSKIDPRARRALGETWIEMDAEIF